MSIKDTSICGSALYNFPSTGNPDSNGNGTGIQFSALMYENAISTMAVVAGSELYMGLVRSATVMVAERPLASQTRLIAEPSAV